MQLAPASSLILGVDIGGTKIHAGASRMAPERLPQLLLTRHIPTPRTPPAPFYDAIAELIRALRAEAELAAGPEAPLVAVAHPGRFLPDGTLARATTPNLGSAPGQFDGVAPARELERRLGWPVIAENDAIAQMRYGLALLLGDPVVRPRLLGETIVYLGPGTGMGGGVAQVSAQGKVIPVTDGHLFDLQVPGVGDGTLTAEELFTGPAIARAVARENAKLPVPILPARGGTLDEILLAKDSQPEHRAAAERLADERGEILAAMIQAIRDGRIVKARLEPKPAGGVRRYVDEADRAWSAADRALVRGARRVILGGFIGCSRGLGARIRAQALAALRARGIDDIEIVQIPSDSADAGLLGIILAAQPRLNQYARAGAEARNRTVS